MSTRTLSLFILLGCMHWTLSSACSGQATTVHPSGKSSVARWPAPIRQAEYHEPLRQGAVYQPIPIQAANASSSHAHQVIRAPGVTPSGKHSKHWPQGGHAHKHVEAHSPHLSLHRRIHAEPAKIPNARQRESWKTPYSYGYFGASGKRQWSQHYGYRDRYTEWRLR